jgi:nicotinate-nucleotide adenylyltransferase
LRIAEVARDEFSLEKVIFVPTYISPHKPKELLIPHEHRVKMLQIALKGNNGFLLSLIEIKRKGISYTIDTLKELKDKYPSRELFLIMGSDSLNEIHTWKNWEEVLSIAHLIVFNRKNCEPLPPSGYINKKSGFYNPDTQRTIEVISTPILDISGEEIRRLLIEGKSVRYLLPDEVLKYIKKLKLQKYWKRKDET